MCNIHNMSNVDIIVGECPAKMTNVRPIGLWLVVAAAATSADSQGYLHGIGCPPVQSVPMNKFITELSQFLFFFTTAAVGASKTDSNSSQVVSPICF